MYCSWHAGSSWGRPKTGLFNVTLGSSKAVLDSITSVTVPKAEKGLAGLSSEEED
jgi:NADH-quinone oxidoreductase subunit B